VIPGDDAAKPKEPKRKGAASHGGRTEQAGDTDTASSYCHQAANIYQQLSNNCLVID
jgi:hypothetical protein